jgi:putative aldouronate transport system substrate-binding protein
MGTDSSAFSRRSFLGATLLGAGAVVGGPALLSACGSGGGGKGQQSGAKDLKDVLPKFAEAKGGPKADIESVVGADGASTDPVYFSYPTDRSQTVSGVPGKGGSYRAITPLWGSIPPADNAYYQAVNKALGANLQLQPADGNSYDKTIPTLVAGNKLPDWLQIPTWWNANLNVGELALSRFADLTPFLSGDNIAKYPNLAALPTGGWQAGAWQGKLYGIPSYSSDQNFAAALFYRGDLLEARGIKNDAIKNADDLLALGQELTSAASSVWAFDGLWWVISQMFKVPPTSSAVTVKDGKVVSAYDTPEHEAALDFAYKVARSGSMHPDALAGKDADGNNRFYGGKVLIAQGGPGAWNLQDSIDGRAVNPNYRRAAFRLFSADGSAPTIALGNSASIVSYLNKNLSKAQLEECLAIANFLAAPYGSKEYTLVKYGVEGTHWTMEAGGPALTSQGTKESAFDTYEFLAWTRNSVTNPGQEQLSKDLHEWAVGAVQHAYKPPFWNFNVSTPSRFASVSTGAAVNDVIKQVTFGKKTVADFRTAAANWKKSGGQQLIDWYQKEVVDKFGTGQ